VLSIAFVLAIVTSAVPKATLFAVFSGLAKGLSDQKLAPFIANMHVALWVLTATSLLGAVVCLMRPRHDVGQTGPSLPSAAAEAETLKESARAAASDPHEREPGAASPAYDADPSRPSVPAGAR